MTRAERWLRKSNVANASRPHIHFSGIRVEAVYSDDLYMQLTQGNNVIQIPLKRIPALTKFQREYFVRRDK